MNARNTGHALAPSPSPPTEKREFHEGTLSVDNSSNASPDGSGPDWATVAQVSFASP